jgi:hypothetical protein
MLIHSITEAFVALHPNEQCTFQTVDYYPEEQGQVNPELPFKVTMPVPNRFPTFISDIKKAVEALGDKVRSIVRRIAPREAVTTTSPISIASPQEMTDEALALIPLIEEERKKRRRT